MEMNIKFTLTLNQWEARALKQLVGNMTDDEFEKAGIKGQDRQLMSDIFDFIPYHEDE